MGEADDPPLFDRPREDRALRLERVEREEILRRELVQQLWRPLDPVDVPLLVGELRARAGLDEHDVVGVADEHAVHVHRDPIEVVRLLLRIPEDLRNDAEHRAAVDLERAVAEDVDLETAEPHGGSMRKWTFGRTTMATAIASARSGSPAGSRSVPATTMHRSQSSPLATQG